MTQQPEDREQRLKNALRANLQKRKIRDRDAPDTGTPDVETAALNASPERAP